MTEDHPMPGSAPARSLRAPESRALVILGALAGAFIGPVGIWVRAAWILQSAPRSEVPVAVARSPLAEAVLPAFRLFESTAGLVVFAVAFLATLTLMPTWLAWLERRAERPGSAYYPTVALGGVVFGAAATALAGAGLAFAILGLGVLAPHLSGGLDVRPLAVLLGAPFIMVAVGVAVVPYFLPVAAVLGVGWGLAFGGMVRARLSRRDA